MTDSCIEVRNGEGTQTWAMKLGAVNPLNPTLLAALDAQLSAAVADESISTIVLTSGLKIFSAGGDATWMGQILTEGGTPALIETFNRTMDTFRELCIRIRRSPLLVIAALNGHTLAGGLELAAACDLRFAANNDKLQIGVPEMDLFGAMPSGGGGAQFIARLMGPSRTLQFILDAKPVTPSAAYALGLIDRLCPPESLLAETESFATDVAKKAGRIGVHAAKRAILGGPELPLLEALEFDRSLHWDAMRRGNFLPGAESFVKRFGSKSG